jgi:quinol monooxygenase YgiN
MAHRGKIQLTFVITAPPDQVEEGDRIFRSHAPWMEATHHREGDKALLSYDLSKAPELSNPMDPSSPPTGNTCFILSEVYESEAGVADHFEQAMASWADFPALGKWLEKCKVTAVPAATIVHSLW